MIIGVSQVIVEVEHQDRAKKFWPEVIGFEATTDAPYAEGRRWIERSPPDGGPLLVLSPRPPTDGIRLVGPVEDPDGTRYALGQRD